MMEAVKTVIRPAAPAPEETKTSVQNARKVPSFFMFFMTERPSLPRGADVYSSFLFQVAS